MTNREIAEKIRDYKNGNRTELTEKGFHTELYYDVSSDRLYTHEFYGYGYLNTPDVNLSGYMLENNIQINVAKVSELINVIKRGYDACLKNTHANE